MSTPVSNLDDAPASKPELTDQERKELLERAIDQREKLAESELEMVRLFLARGKADVARRRLERIVTDFAGSEAAQEAHQLLQSV